MLRLVTKSLARRRLRVAVATAAVALGALLVSALAILSLALGQQTRQELRSYGANIMLTPRAVTSPVGLAGLGMGTVTEVAQLGPEALSWLKTTPPAAVAAYAPFVYGMARLPDLPGRPSIVVAGTELQGARELSPWWRVEGDWPEGPDHILVGADALKKLGLAVGQALPVEGSGGPLTFQVSGILYTGASEESQLVMSLEAAQALLGRSGLDLVLVWAEGGQSALESTVRELEAALPSAQARIVSQVASAERTVVTKVQGLMALVALLVLAASGLAVFSTMATTVLERTPEVGLMKALGASSIRIGLLFSLEALVIGAVGGLAGFGLGSGVAQAIGRSVFGSSLPLSPWALPLTVAVALAVSLLASLLPIRRAVNIEAARTLRGE